MLGWRSHRHAIPLEDRRSSVITHTRRRRSKITRCSKVAPRELEEEDSEETNQEKEQPTDGRSASLSSSSSSSSSSSPRKGGTIVSRRSLFLEVIISIGLCAAVLTGLVLTSKGARRDHRNEEKKRCLDETQEIASLGRHIVMDARQLGVAMMRAAQSEEDGDDRLPFLVPGEAVKGGYLELQRYRHVLYEADEVKATLYISWYPTVMHADRGQFEAHMSSTLDRNVSISQISLDVPREQLKGSVPRDMLHSELSLEELGLSVPAGPRPVYNPLVSVWGLNAESVATFDQLVGTDGIANMKNLYPSMFQDRIFGPEGLPTAIKRPAMINGGYVFAVTVPFCGFDVACNLGGAGDDNTTVAQGFFEYGLLSDDWGRLFRRHTTILNMAGGVISPAAKKKTKRGKSSSNLFSKRLRRQRAFRVHEEFLDLHLVCYYRERYHNFGEGTHVIILLWLGAFGMVAVVFLLTLVQWREINHAEVKAAAHSAAREAHRAARDDETSRIEAARVNSMEVTERYIDHEVKNRLIVLEQIKLCDKCAKSPHHALVLELMETITTKSTLLRLATQRYTPRLEDLDFAALVQLRVSRYNDVDRPTTLSFEEDPGDQAYHLGVDKTLVGIILDNLISNAHKYGDGRPPHVAVSLSVDDAGVEEDDRVEVVIRVSNGAGAEHGRLLEMGEAELNRIALTSGLRAHLGGGGACKERSAGDGFPMSSGAANVLGGSLRLLLREEEVVAELRVGNLKRAVFHKRAVCFPGTRRGGQQQQQRQQRAAVGLDSTNPSSSSFPPLSSFQQQQQPPNNTVTESLTLALVDDCELVRRMFERKLQTAFPVATMHLQGDTQASIDQFARTVACVDADVVFVDQNFGKVNEAISGTDLVLRIRQFDDATNRPSRLIFVISANDSPDDIVLYTSSGADAHVPKTASSDLLRSMILLHAERHPQRFNSHRPEREDHGHLAQAKSTRSLN